MKQAPLAVLIAFFLASFISILANLGGSIPGIHLGISVEDAAQVFFHVPGNASSVNLDTTLQVLATYQRDIVPIVYSSTGAVCSASKAAGVDCIALPKSRTPNDLLASLLLSGRNLRGHTSHLVGFVHADTLFLSGLGATVRGVIVERSKGFLGAEFALLGRVGHAPHLADIGSSLPQLAQRGNQDGVAAQDIRLRLQDSLEAGAPGQHAFVLGTRSLVQRSLLPAHRDSVWASTPSELASLLSVSKPRPQMVDVSDSLTCVHWGPPTRSTLSKLVQGVSAGPVDLGTLRAVTAQPLDGQPVFVRLVAPQTAGAPPQRPAPQATAAATARAPVIAAATTAGPSQQIHQVHALPPITSSAPPPAAAVPETPAKPPRLQFDAPEPVSVLPPCPPTHKWAQRAVVGSITGNRTYCVPGETAETVLTAFTTLMMRESADLGDPHTAQKVLIQRNVLRGLAALSPQVRTVVFTDSTVFRGMAEELGMVVVSGVRSTSFGLPYIKAMYEWVEARTGAPMHGYMNGDILFGPRLIELVDVCLQHLEKGLVLPRVLLTGRRFNVQMPLPLLETHSDMIPEGVTRADLEQRVGSFRARGAMFQADAEDYFFITRGTWRWEAIPDFVPGRAAYDNWLVDHSYRDQVERVDVTRCVFAIHQSGSDGHKAGLNQKRAEPNWNMQAMTHYIGGFSHGRTDNCNMVLQCPAGQGIGLRRLPGRQRPGERGPPWTGVKYHGHIDPTNKKQWVCDNPGLRGQLMGPRNKCHYK